jgi:hypothetical protein
MLKIISVPQRSESLQLGLGLVLLGVRLLYHNKIVVCLLGLLLLWRWLFIVFEILGVFSRRVGELREHVAGFCGRLERVWGGVFCLNRWEEGADVVVSAASKYDMTDSRNIIKIRIFVLVEEVAEDDAV